MIIGVVSDIHANRVALETVLDDMPPVDQLVCLGDIVGYGPHARVCVERVREEFDIVVQGNHDRAVQEPIEYRDNEMAFEGLRYAKEQLSSEQIQWLDSLPVSCELTNSILAVHSHPTNRDQYVKPNEFYSLRPFLTRYNGILMGHTHLQHAENIDSNLLLNAGSVGQPRDDDPRSAYALIDTTDLSYTFHRVGYDIDTVSADIKAVGLPDLTGIRLYDSW